jgi:hypothetical protein
MNKEKQSFNNGNSGISRRKLFIRFHTSARPGQEGKSDGNKPD